MKRMKKLFSVKFSTEILTCLALFVAMQVVLGSLAQVQWTDKKQFNLGFLPIAIAGAVFGPTPAMIVGALGDVIGTFLFPQGAYFWGFTISQALVGLIYGLFLYQYKLSLRRTVLCCVMVSCLYLFLNSYWIHLLYGPDYQVYIAVRWWMYLVETPVSVTIIYYVRILLNKHRLPILAKWTFQSHQEKDGGADQKEGKRKE